MQLMIEKSLGHQFNILCPIPLLKFFHELKLSKSLSESNEILGMKSEIIAAHEKI